jgi:hypothetical protein
MAIKICKLTNILKCWINDAFSLERLWLHYFWIFIAMFSTSLIYAFIFLYLHRRSRKDPVSRTRVPHGATPLMILYPFIYILCTAPLAAGRIYALAGHTVSLGFFCAAGTMIACNGWLDVLLYASTRSNIVFSEYPPGEDTGLETFAFMGNRHRLGTVTTIEARGERVASRLAKGPRRSNGGDSVENLYGLDHIGVKGEVTVTVDVVQHGELRQQRVGTDNSASASWDGRSGKSEDTREDP